MVLQKDLMDSTGSAAASGREGKANSLLARFPWKIFSIIFAAAYLFVVAFFGDVDAAAMLSYFLGQVVFTLLPGMAFASLVRITGNKIKFICLSYFLGIFINIICYIAVYLAGAPDALLWVLIAVSALSLILIYKKRDVLKSLREDNAGAAMLSLVTAGLLIVILVYTILNNFTPDFTPNTFYYHDMLFNTGNITALYLRFPPLDIRDLGMSFNYHYLYTIFLAVYKNIFGISSFNLNFKLFPVTQILLFASSFYILFSRYIKNMLFAGIAIVLVLLSDEFIFIHVMWAAFSTTFGIVLCMVSVYFFMKYMENMENAKIRDKNFWMAILFFGMASFAKGPFALVLLAAFGILLVYQLFRRKNPKTVVVHGLIALAVIGVSYLVIMWNVSGFNVLTKEFATLMTRRAPDYYQWAQSAWGGSMSPLLIKALTYPVYLLLNYTAVVIAFFMLLFSMIKWRREDIKKELFLFSFISAGVLLASVTAQPGLSNMFFIMIAVPVSLLSIIIVFKRMGSFRSIIKKILLIAVASAIVISAGFNIRDAKNFTIMSIRQYPSAGLTDNPALNTTPGANSISYDEYLGMLWLKENTPKDAVVAGDRYYYTPSEVLNDARYFYYTAFSERQFYLEGYNYTNTTEENYQEIITDKLATMKLVYQNDAAAIEKLRQAGVTYLVRSEFASPSFQLDPRYGKVVYGNKDIVIYELY